MFAPTDTWLVWAIIIAGVAACIYLEQNYKWAAKTSGPVLALVVGMLLSNLKIMPVEAPAYDFIDDYLVPLAMPLLLLRANIVRIFSGTGKMFLAFHVATVGTMLGGFLAAGLFKDKIPHFAEVTGTMAASYIGGGVNFVAVKNTYKLPSELTNPLLVADNFIMAGMFAILFLISTSNFFLKKFGTSQAASNMQDASALAAAYWKRKEISLADIAQAMAISFVIVALSFSGTSMIKAASNSKLVTAFFGNAYLLMTLLTVICTTVFTRWTEKITCAEELGGYFLYLFFFVIGLRADLIQVVMKVPLLFAFCLVMAVTNLVFTLAVGRLLKIKLEELLLAVNATLGGAPSAGAMAIAKGWSGLVLPGILAGIWGYVIGTFLGIVCAEGVRYLF